MSAAYVLNRTPSRVIGFKTPYEQFFGHRLQVLHTRTFSCAAYALTPRTKISAKMAPRSKNCVLWDESTTIHRLWYPATGAVSKYSDVVFNEEELYEKQQDPAEKMPQEKEKARLLDVEETPVERPVEETPVEDLSNMAQKSLDLLGPDILPSNEPIAAAVSHVSKKQLKINGWRRTFQEVEKSPLREK